MSTSNNPTDARILEQIYDDYIDAFEEIAGSTEVSAARPSSVGLGDSASPKRPQRLCRSTYRKVIETPTQRVTRAHAKKDPSHSR